MELTGLFISSFMLTCGLVWAIRSWARNNLLDVPNERSSHQIPTPRGGGIGIVISFTVFFASYCLLKGSFTNKYLVFIAASLAVAFVSLADDIYTLSNKLRFSVHFLAASAVIYTFFQTENSTHFLSFKGLCLAFISIFWIVGLTNAYNFMDGIDGIAALQGFSVGILWTIYGFMVNEAIFSIIGILSSAGCLGFYLFNRQPATIFMGDVGSAFLGFIFAAIPFLAQKHSFKHFILAGIFIIPFVSDTSITLIKRILKRENIFQAHRSHFYQLMVIKGFEHRWVSLVYAFASVLLGVTALLIYRQFWQ